LIYSRIAACIAEIGAVGKDHRNQQQGYSFRAIDDFYNALQPVLARNRVFITPTILEHKREERTTKSGGILMTTLAHVRFRVWTEDGSFIEADALGEGSDSGDKSANKSASQALKYLFMQVFCVRVSGESGDTENESPAYAAPKPAQGARREYPVSNERTYQKPAPQASQERTAAAPADVLPRKATEATRDWAWKTLVAQFDADPLMKFLASKQWLDETNAWKLEYVPTSKQALGALADEIAKTATLPSVEPPPQTDLPPEIADAVITVPRRGMKRDDYLRAPDTLGSLYAAMKNGDADARKRLWGLAKNWTPEPFIGQGGKKYPVSAEDAQCRIDLDMFVDFMESRGEKE
jgi:hypothetical protein